MAYVKAAMDRMQAQVLAWDGLVDENSMARVIDAFVDSLDLKEMGFLYADGEGTGRPAFPPACLLKLYMHGYRNGIRSSRKLARACRTDIEAMWLMEGRKPDFRTIADFRKDNIKCMKGVFKEFTRRIAAGQEKGALSVDGTKIRAWNAKDKNFTAAKLDERIEWLGKKAGEYLSRLDEADEAEEKAEGLLPEGALAREELEAKLEAAQKRLALYKECLGRMEEEGLSQVSLTDGDAMLMKDRDGMNVCYNVQSAVDTETHLIMECMAAGQVRGHGLLAPVLEGLKEDGEVLECVADKGYVQPEDMEKCLLSGIVPNVIPQEGQGAYTFELDYVENRADASSTKGEEVKKCLQAGIVPEAYKGKIKDIRIEEKNRRVKDGAGEGAEEEKQEKGKSPYGTPEEMEGKAVREGCFVRDPGRDVVYCPGGVKLRKKADKKRGVTRYANKAACRKCRHYGQCVGKKAGVKAKWKEVDFSKDTLVKPAKWHEGSAGAEGTEKRGTQGEWAKGTFHYEKRKVVRFTFEPDERLMEKRKCTSEHPFGTMKRAMGMTHFLLKGLEKADGESALFCLSYNMARAEHMYQFGELLRKVRQKAA